MDWKITLSEPDITKAELKAVTDVVKSKWFTMGAVTIEFEKKFSEMLGVKHAFAVTNCTAALHIANLALDIKAGDEVIVPALTFVATANAVKYTGAGVVFADSVSGTDLTVSADSIEKSITNKTKAITVVHYAGFACDMEKIIKIAKKYKLKVIEDCAHSSFGKCRVGDKIFSLGTIGDIGCFSFFSNKNMTTGEGGMIVTNNDKLAEKIRLLRSHGMTTLTYDRHKGHQSGYDVVALGYNYRIDEIRSALGIAQLSKVVKNNAKRRELYKYYYNCLKKNKNVIFPFADFEIELSTPHIMPVIVKARCMEIKAALKNSGVQTSKHYDLIPNFTLYKKSGFVSKVKFIDNIITLPLYPHLKKNDIKFICDIINNN
jgi:dTDP-4-amino-4,6-dideoxygalactose transaminase